MSKSQQPKPCPFCGWGTIIDGGLLLSHVCECNSCHAKTKKYKTWEEAVEAWNQRIVEQTKTRDELHDKKEIIRLNEIINNMELQLQIQKAIIEACIANETYEESWQQKFDSIQSFANYMKALNNALLTSFYYQKENITVEEIEKRLERFTDNSVEKQAYMEVYMKFNTEIATNKIIAWIQHWFTAKGPEHKAIIGISGGIDSSVVAALCVKALGKDSVIGVIMPNGSQADINDSYALCGHLGISHYYGDINDAFRSIINICESKGKTASDQTFINLPPRLRMAVLYAIAQTEKGFVANTCNYSESYIGYDTLWGDDTGSFAPIAELTKSEVKEVGKYLLLPSSLIQKSPADGLSGKTDEDSFGFTYDILDTYLRNHVCPEEIKIKIDSMHQASEFKRRMVQIECCHVFAE